jgi:DNA helicase-2/ATP-dependent DNA helicase PcrA
MAGEVMEEISRCLDQKKNFLLSGGAGSGKTYTLIQTLHQAYGNRANAHVACITYTNVAADEIKRRSPYSKLWVSTIHDFLWEDIKGFQKNIGNAIRQLISNGEMAYSGELPIDSLDLSHIDYKNYRKIEDGIISHDDILKIAEYMFEHHPLLSKILCDKFDYIFIDEYQDTQGSVIRIFLDCVDARSNGKICFGFFGDKMQSIYDTGIVDIQSYIDRGQVEEIIKTDNYRCSQKVIEVLNRIRSDLSQQPSNKDANGSIQNEVGSVKFLYSNNDFDLSRFKEGPYGKDWDFDPSKTKLLFLTHRLISKRSGWDGILSAYKNNDRLLGDEPDRLASHLLTLGEIIKSFQLENYSLVISSIKKKIHKLQDKQTIALFLKSIVQDTTIETIDIGTAIDRFDAQHILEIDDKLKEYISKNTECYEIIRKIPLSQVLSYYDYYNKFSPYSTQHGIKGAEFDNVLVVMDNGKWNNYNFQYYFEERQDKESIVNRTQRIFYVCCSRAIENLVVYSQNPSPGTISKAKQLFGEQNVVAV